MPTYEYEREDGTRFETMQSITADPLEVCPTTGQKVRRVIYGGIGVYWNGDGSEVAKNYSEKRQYWGSPPEDKKDYTKDKYKEKIRVGYGD